MIASVELMRRTFYKMESGGKEVIRTHQVAQPLGAISCACITVGLLAINWYCSHNYAYEKLFIFTGTDIAHIASAVCYWYA